MRVLVACWLVAFAGAAELPARAADDPADSHPDLHLIPWPKSFQLHAGQLPLTEASRIVAGDESLLPLAKVLSDEMARLCGLKFSVASGRSQAADIVLKINPAIKAGEPILAVRSGAVTRTTEGAHTVSIGEQAVVEGFDYRATAEGTSTILQLLTRGTRGISLPRVTISDWPHADFCGVMLDVARQDHSIADIKRVVQLCRFYKARYLQLHLTDDQGWTFPSTKYPALGSKNYGAHGGVAPRVYKLAELKDLVAYADARGVTIVPELELPGHSGAALRSAPEIFDAINPQSKQPVGMGCMNMSNDAIYPALDAIIREMCDVFRSSPYFHIGSDEVTSGRLSLHPGYKAFMAKHGLKDDHQLADHFIAAACAIVKKRGKMAIKWEGLSNYATKDVIIMAWDANSTVASEALARGYTTITCPWHLGVPWEQWNLYVCNGSRLKKGDSVLGATLVAWEQSPQTHLTNLRDLASRQERTWGPDNSVTVEGFAARSRPLDAAVGRLIDMPPKPRLPATFSVSCGTRDYLEPAFAFDGNDATFFESESPLKTGDSFTVAFATTRQVHSIEVLTGVNGRGRLNGAEVQVSTDGATFTTIATLHDGVARAALKENRVRAVRIRATSDQLERLVLREIKLRLLVDLSGRVPNPAVVVQEGNVAALSGDAEFAYPIGTFAAPIINRSFTLRINNGGNSCAINGPITGSGRVEIHGPAVLAGETANSLAGAWVVKGGQVELRKPRGMEAMGRTITVEAGSLMLGADDQINDAAVLSLSGGGTLDLNGHRETIARLDLAGAAAVLTNGPAGHGVLTTRRARRDGKDLPKGIYTSSAGWIRGSGYVIVGDVKLSSVSGSVDDPERRIGAGNLAVLTAPATFNLPGGDCSVSVNNGSQALTLAVAGDARFGGLVTGDGTLEIDGDADRPLTLGGPTSNSYKGGTTLRRGVLILAKLGGAVAIPGNLTLGGSDPTNRGDTLRWAADGQIAATAVVTARGTQPAFLDLNGHRAEFTRLDLAKAAKILTGATGSLRVRQLFVDGARLADADYAAPQSWLAGAGVVRVDSRVDVRGVIGSPETAIGVGNIGNLTADTKIAYPSSGGDFDVWTNGFTLTLDSGDGNAFSYSGAISGTGNVEFFMGPSHTGYRDAPLALGGRKANTSTGKYFVRKGRVQLEKPEGVDAISGDVVVGGQGFNDCLFWKNSHQLKDTVNITLLDAGNSGAAYLHLNGCREVAASLTMTANNRVLTDSERGVSGSLRVKALSVGGKSKPAGIYTAVTEPWIEGRGSVIVGR
jgi:hexosaminidase